VLKLRRNSNDFIRRETAFISDNICYSNRAHYRTQLFHFVLKSHTIILKEHVRGCHRYNTIKSANFVHILCKFISRR